LKKLNDLKSKTFSLVAWELFYEFCGHRPFYFISVSGTFLGTSLPSTPNRSRFDFDLYVYFYQYCNSNYIACFINCIIVCDMSKKMANTPLSCSGLGAGKFCIDVFAEIFFGQMKPRSGSRHGY
jgi:hypothetical protein